MDDIEKIVNDLVDNHYRRQHLIGTEADESEYLADISEDDDENL
jgi:hypothetical protein